MNLKFVFTVFMPIACMGLSFCTGCNSTDKNLQDKDPQAPANKASSKNTQLAQNVAYGSDPSYLLDIYFPETGQQNNKTILYVHGGAWLGGDKTEAIHWANYFRDLGYTFVCMNYRLTNTAENHIHPAQVQDIDSAVNFILNRSTSWNIPKEKLIIMGASAGGHLSLLYAYRYNKAKKIKLAISLCGILDLADPKLQTADLGDMNGGTMITLYIGDTITHSREQWKNASPFYNISPSAVPTFFIHGKEDELIPYQQPVRAYNRLQDLRIPAQLILLEGVSHNLLGINLANEFNEADRFIRSNLKD